MNKLKFHLQDGVIGSPEYIDGDLLIDYVDFLDYDKDGLFVNNSGRPYFCWQNSQTGTIYVSFKYINANHVIWFGDSPWPEWAEKV